MSYTRNNSQNWSQSTQSPSEPQQTITFKPVDPSVRKTRKRVPVPVTKFNLGNKKPLVMHQMVERSGQDKTPTTTEAQIPGYSVFVVPGCSFFPNSQGSAKSRAARTAQDKIGTKHRGTAQGQQFKQENRPHHHPIQTYAGPALYSEKDVLSYVQLIETAVGCADDNSTFTATTAGGPEPKQTAATTCGSPATSPAIDSDELATPPYHLAASASPIAYREPTPTTPYYLAASPVSPSPVYSVPTTRYLVDPHPNAIEAAIAFLKSYGVPKTGVHKTFYNLIIEHVPPTTVATPLENASTICNLPAQTFVSPALTPSQIPQSLFTSLSGSDTTHNLSIAQGKTSEKLVTQAEDNPACRMPSTS